MAHPSLDEQQQAALIDLYRKALRSGVPLEEIEGALQKQLARQAVSTQVEAEEEVEQAVQLQRATPAVVRLGAFLLPLTFIGVGLFLVGSATLPMLRYYWESLTSGQVASLTSPIPAEQVMDVTPLVITQEVQAMEVTPPAAPKIIDTQLDYTNLSNWFGAEATAQLHQSEEVTYTIDIPAVDIENAAVTVGGTDLNESLIAYPGTALPGELGSPVIFGHSVLRQFYNPQEKNPRRYNSIFSYIMTLKKGDKIYVTRDGVKYTYMVTDKSEVKPEDVYILSQRYDNKQLKLVTCVPEGTYLRRGVVTAQLVPPDDTKSP